MVNNSTNINKINNHLSLQLTKHKKTWTNDVENPGPHLGRTQKGGDVKPANLPFLITGSPTSIHI